MPIIFYLLFPPTSLTYFCLLNCTWEDSGTYQMTQASGIQVTGESKGGKIEPSCPHLSTSSLLWVLRQSSRCSLLTHFFPLPNSWDNFPLLYLSLQVTGRRRGKFFHDFPWLLDSDLCLISQTTIRKWFSRNNLVYSVDYVSCFIFHKETEHQDTWLNSYYGFTEKQLADIYR